MSGPGILIRKATLRDRDGVLSLWMALMKEQEAVDPRFILSADAGVRWKNDFPEWLHGDDFRILVAESNDSLAGYASAQLWMPPPVYRAVPEVYLNEIYCSAEYRGIGLGAKLFEGIEMWCRELGIGRIRLGVLYANEQALDFWKDRGATAFSVTLTKEVL